MTAPTTTISTRALARTALALVAFSLVPACSDGGLDRADGPPTYQPPSGPYTPSTPNPAPGTSGAPNTPGEQTPPPPGTPVNENGDDELPLEPNAPINSQLGSATMGGSGSTQERYFK